MTIVTCHKHGTTLVCRTCLLLLPRDVLRAAFTTFGHALEGNIVECFVLVLVHSLDDIDNTSVLGRLNRGSVTRSDDMAELLRQRGGIRWKTHVVASTTFINNHHNKLTNGASHQYISSPVNLLTHFNLHIPQKNSRAVAPKLKETTQ